MNAPNRIQHKVIEEANFKSFHDKLNEASAKGWQVAHMSHHANYCESSKAYKTLYIAFLAKPFAVKMH